MICEGAVTHIVSSFVMMVDNNTFLRQWKTRLHGTWVGRLFWDKKFAHYTWIGIFISLLNIFFLWLLIDVIEISTVVSSIIVVAVTFILRYILFGLFKVL